ncbi:MAG TPA: TatD family hydrolase [Phycisphaerae bacterium]|nr:TatD family hydrolase [Phycisphaerae bacterium]
MELIDTHAHLTYPELSAQLPLVMADARAAGVARIITIGSDAVDSQAALELATTHPMLACTAGIHPHEAAKVADGDFKRIRELAADPHVVAVGEIGLDYHYDFADRETQHWVLVRQLDIARSSGKPIVVHCREAFPDCVSLLEQNGFRNRKVVFHCFTGTAEEAATLAAHGWRISFTGIVTFKNSTELQAIARDYPADQLMLETDAPYLSPIPVRSVRPNVPAHVAHTAAFLAELRGVPLEELAAQTTANARAFFDLKS